MKDKIFWQHTALIFGLSLLLQWVLPWWITVVVAAIVGFYLVKRQAFWIGFFGIGLLWWLASGIVDWQTQSILSLRIAELFRVPHPILLVILTGIIGGIMGGLGCMSGFRLAVFAAQKKSRK